jgi:hypothetical protein
MMQDSEQRHDHKTRLLISKPGQWIDRFGKPRDKPAIHRILVLKADHIGDLLIAERDFAPLRLFFPEARLETRLRFLERRACAILPVYGVNFFHELSGFAATRESLRGT